MATTITGKLNKDANQFQAGDSTGFGIRLGVKYQDTKTKQDEWCNYSAVIFAKSQGQIEFYQQALIAGSIVEVSCEKQSVEAFSGQNGTSLTINMLNARLGYVHTAQQSQGQQNNDLNYQNYQQQGQQGNQQNQQQMNQQQPNPRNHGQWNNHQGNSNRSF